jgi:hypothetical protein
MLPHIRTRISLSESLQTSPACPSDKTVITMKMSMEYWGNENWQIKPQYSKKTSSISGMGAKRPPTLPLKGSSPGCNAAGV